tara:strand:+ start:124 stop:1041 length:918 start_codon:yes stop_codon:yes gene_type:complete
MSKKIIIRILGNDFEMHGEDRTYINLEFTLDNEKNFKDTTKLFILNKIIDSGKKKRIINLLKKHNIKYIDFPFDKTEYNKLKNKNWNDIENFFEKISYEDKDKEKWIPCISKNRKHILNKLNPFNQYIINNNGMRNIALDYGKKSNYDWIFVLDSNNFILEDDYNYIFSTLDPATEYIILPTKRLTDNDFDNIDVFNYKKIEELDFHEPQIGFKNTSQLYFNKHIPYGSSPKVELLQVLGVKGKWDEWNDYEKYFNIKCREKCEVEYQISSKIIRLKSSSSGNNNTRINWYKRIIDFYNLLKDIK